MNTRNTPADHCVDALAYSKMMRSYDIARKRAMEDGRFVVSRGDIGQYDIQKQVYEDIVARNCGLDYGEPLRMMSTIVKRDSGMFERVLSMENGRLATGTKVVHDEFGYGYIIGSFISDYPRYKKLVYVVKFENCNNVCLIHYV